MQALSRLISWQRRMDRLAAKQYAQVYLMRHERRELARYQKIYLIGFVVLALSTPVLISWLRTLGH